MKRNDFILIGVILLIAGVVFAFYKQQNKVPVGEEPVSAVVSISVAGKDYQKVSLDENQELEIPGAYGGTNHLKIEDGYATMVEASCPDHLCVYQSDISKNGEMIVCLPNQVLVIVEGGEAGWFDGVAN